jgi:hypothetical protein
MLKNWRKFSLLLSILLTVAYSTVSGAQTPTFDLHEKSFRCHFAEEAKKSIGDLNSDEFRQMSKEAIEDTTATLQGEKLSRREKKILKEHLKLLKSLEKIEDPKSEIIQFYSNFCLSTDSVFKSGIKGVAHTTNVINLTLSFPVRFLARFIVGLKSGAETTISPMGVNDILGNKRITSIGYFFLYRAYSVALGSNPLVAPLLAVPLVNALILRVCTESTHLNEKDQNFCKNFLKTKTAFFNAANVGQKWGASLSHKAPQKAPSPWREEITDANFCEYLINVSESKTAKFKAEEFREALVSSLNPGYMAKPDTKVILTSDELFIKQNASSFPKLRNIIVSLAPPEDLIKKMKSSGSWDAYNELQKELSNQRKIFNKLYRQKDLNKCRQLKIKKKFDYAYYVSLKEKLEGFKNESLYDQHLIVENQFKSLSSKFNLFNSTQLKWELIPSNTLNIVKELLQQSNVGNLIIITHSVGDYKKMIDSTFNQYPSTYFGSLSPGLMSLSFYTCHSENILETYGLSKVFEESPSIHKKKILNFVQENDILEDGEQVPLKGFTDFLMKVDSSLSFTIQENLMSQAFSSSPLKENTEKKCSIEIPMKKPISGSLSLILNRQFIGNLNRFEQKTQFEFDCSLLKQKNTLLLQNSALIEKLEVDSIPDTVLLNGEIILNLDWKNFFDLNGIYSSSKIKF